MTTYESEIKYINKNQEDVFAILSDLNNIEQLNKLQNSTQTIDNNISDYLQDVSFDSDSINFNVTGIGNIGLRIIEREPSKTIKFATENSPMNANAWIQLLPMSGQQQTKMKITLKVDLHMMVKMMLNDKLKKAVNKAADTIVNALNEKEIIQ